MKIETSGVVMVGECEVQSDRCTAREPRPITAVWTAPSRRQVNVCRACLDEMIRVGQWELDDARLPRRSDIAVLGPKGQPVLIVETKLHTMGGSGSGDWARQVRRALMNHGALPAAGYFMLVLVPTTAYLWTCRSMSDPNALPEYEIDMEAVLRPYHEEPTRAELPAWKRAETAVAAWLTDVLQAGSAEPWYTDSGLAAATKRGEVVVEYAA